MTKNLAWRYFIVSLGLAYLLIIIKFIIFKHPIDLLNTQFFLSLQYGNYNYVPLKSIFGYVSGMPTWSIAVRNLFGNIVLFVPLGIFLPLIFQAISWRSVICTALVVSVIFEVTQIFLVGTPDIDDVLLNTLGASVGYLVFKGVVVTIKRNKTKHS